MQIIKTLSFLFFLYISFVSHAQTIPYNVQKKKYPLGEQFQNLLPLKLEKWNRYAYHDFVPNHETGYVYYRKDNQQVYLTFGKAYSLSGLNAEWSKIYDDAKESKPGKLVHHNPATTATKYLYVNGNKTCFFAWTRNFYYFTVEAKSKTLVDEFMKVFPY